MALTSNRASRYDGAVLGIGVTVTPVLDDGGPGAVTEGPGSSERVGPVLRMQITSWGFA
jgi:hypothetical protein